MRCLLSLALCCLLYSPVLAAEAPLLGISANLKEGGTLTDLVRELQDLRKQGVTMMFASYKWSDLEPKEGAQNLKELENGLRGFPSLGYKLVINIQTLDTNNRTLPADLMEKPFDAPEMRERFDALLRNIAPKLNDSVKAVMLGNEVDAYLAAHRNELEPYAGFVERGRKLLRSLRPALPVGVTTMYSGLSATPDLFKRLNRETDLVTLTYYPLDATFGVKPPSVVAGDFDAMARAAGNKPLLVQEAGYPADPLLGSTEEKQAQFVDAVFDAMKRHADRLLGVNFFLLYDFNDTLVETFLKYYRLPDVRFRAYLATLGLKKTNGTPRQAWSRFLERARKMNPASQ